MVKAVFIDYTGTIIQEECQYAVEMARYISKNSNLKDIGEIFNKWWSIVKPIEEKSYGDNYLTEDHIVIYALDMLKRDYGFNGDYNVLAELFHKLWSDAPMYDDVREFFDRCKLPIYILTNNGEKYVRAFLNSNKLNCAGVICGDMVRAYKPNRLIFQKALEISNTAKEFVVHIGDSISSDVEGAVSAGITPILLDRKGIMNYNGCAVKRNLIEVLDSINNMSNS